MASLIFGRRIFSMRKNLFKTSVRKESGFYVLLPEIGEDLPDKNPLLKEETMLPEFNCLTIEKCIAAIAKQTIEFEQKVKAVEKEIEETENINVFKDVLEPIEKLEMPLQTVWGISKVLYFGNQSLMPTKCYFSIHKRSWTAVSFKHNSKPIYELCKKMKENMKDLTEEQKRILDKFILEGKLNGLDLSEKNKHYFQVHLNEIATRGEKFQMNVEKVTNKFKHKITNAQVMRGFPVEFLKKIAVDSTQYEVGPWIITLQSDIVQIFLEYCPDSLLRWNIWQANALKCSMFGDQIFENSSLVSKITTDKLEVAKYLGFKHYFEMSMCTKMAGNIDTVNKFLSTLLKAAYPSQVDEINQLTAFARERGFVGKLQQWDLAYWSRKQKKTLYNYDEELLKEYFPLPVVLNGVFKLIKYLFNVEFIERIDEKVDVWHKDVRFFDVYDHDVSTSEPVGNFYFDPYVRGNNKVFFNRNCGWILLLRNKSTISELKPLTSMIFNFEPPEGNGKPSLLTFKGIQSLFESFGHMLQQVLTRVNSAEVAGLSNVEWDATGVSKYLMSHWVYQPHVLKSISSHIETGEPIDDNTITNLKLARTHMAGFNLCKELYLCRFDLDLHSVNRPWEHIMKKAWNEHFVIAEEKKDSHVCSWTELFAENLGGSYYSDLWSKMLAADVYSTFEESEFPNDEHHRLIGKRFKDTFLSLGGSIHTGEIFRRFRGRDPSFEAFMKNLNLTKLE